MFFGISTWEFVILVVLAAALIGPERLPEYVGKLRTFIRQARDMVDGAKTQIKDQIGPEFLDINWYAYDLRQYDPRKIMRDALFDDPAQPDAAAMLPTLDLAQQTAVDCRRFNPDRATPFDYEAT